MWRVEDKQGIEYMVKLVANHSGELRAIRKMTALGPSPHNHTIPVQIIECTQTSLILMPYLWTFGSIIWKDAGLHLVYDFFDQILQVRLPLFA